MQEGTCDLCVTFVCAHATACRPQAAATVALLSTLTPTLSLPCSPPRPLLGAAAVLQHHRHAAAAAAAAGPAAAARAAGRRQLVRTGLAGQADRCIEVCLRSLLWPAAADVPLMTLAALAARWLLLLALLWMGCCLLAEPD